MTEIQGLTPTLFIRTIYCIGRNYADHARELQNEVPKEPVVFLKPAGSVIGDGDTILLPSQSQKIHHEVELLIAIGKTGKRIPEKKAMENVAGYGIGIDVTARDLQQQAKDKRRPWAVAKGFDTFAPMSRFLPVEEFDNPDSIALTLSVNGEIRQQAKTDLMIFSVPKLIAYLSTIFTLNAGDIIFTGTPDGVSEIQKGDLLETNLNNGQITLEVGVN